MGTHDFIKFPPNLKRVIDSPRIWFLAGEIQARILHLQRTPIPPARMSGLRLLYIRKGVHGTTAIEGNPLTEDQVGTIIADDQKLPSSLGYHEREVQNIKTAIETVGSEVLQGKDVTFSLELLNRYHSVLLCDLAGILEEGVLIGELRTHSVVVKPYRGAPAEDCDRLVNEYCKWLNDNSDVPEGNEGYAIARQLIKALVAHVYFAWIHPYGDGNGRMARLIEFVILLRAGVPDIAAHLLSNFYYRTVETYWRELQLSHGEHIDGIYPKDGDLSSFIEYALEGYREELEEQCAVIYSHQINVIWHDYIHSTFPRNPSKIEQRQKRLAPRVDRSSFSGRIDISRRSHCNAHH